MNKLSYDLARKPGRPVQARVRQVQLQHLTSRCVMAGAPIAHGLGEGVTAEHPISLLRFAYGI